MRFIYSKKIKISLVFFCIVLLCSCKYSQDENATITQVSIDRKQVSFETESAFNNLNVALENQANTAILGAWSTHGQTFTFTPILPFTIGEIYYIKDGDSVVHVFSVEDTPKDSATEVVAIYPTSGYLPENLLKMYIVFSKPMQEIGNSLDYISVHDHTTNKNVSVFLELQTELWNKDHTVLTLWLDPGRVKTNLIPNKKLGLPLIQTHQYTLSIDATWKDATGAYIIKPHVKTFGVVARDHAKPDPKHWTITTPKKDTKGALIINFNESLDYFLAMECLAIMDAGNNKIKGYFSLLNNEKELHFYPISGWKKGDYSISVENRLEDLAGNNLDHLFDTDLNALPAVEASLIMKPLSFTIN